jgi:hypothetical protein
LSVLIPDIGRDVQEGRHGSSEPDELGGEDMEVSDRSDFGVYQDARFETQDLGFESLRDLERSACVLKVDGLISRRTSTAKSAAMSKNAWASILTSALLLSND